MWPCFHNLGDLTMIFILFWMSTAFDNIQITSPKLRHDILVDAGIANRAIILLTKAGVRAPPPKWEV